MSLFSLKIPLELGRRSGYKGAMLRRLLPKPLKRLGRKAIKTVKYEYRRARIRGPVARGQNIKIILGAAETFQEGWYSTNENWLDIARADHWEKVFGKKPLVTRAVAEHVFEHLTYEEAQRALKHIYEHMPKGGRIRVAVPDGYNPNPEYIRHVGIAGIGDDAADHKQLLNVDVLTGLIASAGFTPVHIEGYTKSGTLIQNEYDPRDGFIKRSRRNHGENMPWSFPDADTSLIVDGIKN